MSKQLISYIFAIFLLILFLSFIYPNKKDMMEGMINQSEAIREEKPVIINTIQPYFRVLKNNLDDLENTDIERTMLERFMDITNKLNVMLKAMNHNSSNTNFIDSDFESLLEKLQQRISAFDTAAKTVYSNSSGAIDGIVITLREDVIDALKQLTVDEQTDIDAPETLASLQQNITAFTDEFDGFLNTISDVLTNMNSDINTDKNQQTNGDITSNNLTNNINSGSFLGNEPKHFNDVNDVSNENSVRAFENDDMTVDVSKNKPPQQYNKTKDLEIKGDGVTVPISINVNYNQNRKDCSDDDRKKYYNNNHFKRDRYTMTPYDNYLSIGDNIMGYGYSFY